jgi:hypothetical protein
MFVSTTTRRLAPPLPTYSASEYKRVRQARAESIHRLTWNQMRPERAHAHLHSAPASGPLFDGGGTRYLPERGNGGRGEGARPTPEAGLGLPGKVIFRAV